VYCNKLAQGVSSVEHDQRLSCF